jgi:hypothetical protein
MKDNERIELYNSSTSGTKNPLVELVLINLIAREVQFRVKTGNGAALVAFWKGTHQIHVEGDEYTTWLHDSGIVTSFDGFGCDVLEELIRNMGVDDTSWVTPVLEGYRDKCATAIYRYLRMRLGVEVLGEKVTIEVIHPGRNGVIEDDFNLHVYAE